MDFPEIAFNYQKAGNIGIESISLEDLYKRAQVIESNPVTPHRLNFYNLIFVEQGSGKHLIDFIDYNFEPGSFILVHPDQVHAYDLDADTRGEVLLFTKSFVEQVLNNMRMPGFSPNHLGVNYQPVITPSDAGLSSCVLLMAELSKELANPDRGVLILMHLFSCLLLMLRRERHETEQNMLSVGQVDKLNRFLDLLHNNFTIMRDANLYADKIHTTYKTLNQVCKKGTGQTAKQLIDAYTLLEAKRRLVIDSCTTQQLAWDLGFNDASNFVKYFKKHTHYTPSGFRKQYTRTFS
ncbi:AraC family transcriptional regulator [Neptunomonas japonica]|uniref:AraC family transcriptional regulator n=1 Tax=Neptunomonas japonica TaxID=417574 RepID=UPI00041C685A|nr:helix-turn-helix domain-containing protein [Neptunomonas japonica]